MNIMHKDFYASGFLYHPRSQQILLQQINSANNDSTWSLLGGSNKKKENFEEAFLRIINSHLKLKLKPSFIHPVYDYFNIGKNKKIYIYYANVSKRGKFKGKKKIFSWFTFRQIQKLPIPEQIRHDIVVGQRVIESSIRKRLGFRT